MLNKQYGIRTALTFLAFACLMQTQLAPRLALAAGSAVVSEQVMNKDIGLLENRFFSRLYTNDPIEKRLERLELMVFGGTQDGDNEHRLGRLKKAVADRAEQQPAAKGTAADSKAAPKEKAQSSTQYTALNTLEWRVFKKTFAADSLDDRLSRLEKKLFGADSPSMAYIDRVDRLKRTLGIGVPVAQQPTGPLGPAPKARPRGQMGSDFWSFGTPLITGMVPHEGDFFGDEDMGLPPVFGFGLSSSINNMFRDMERQMMQLQQLPPGSYTFDPKTNSWVDQNNNHIKPDGGSGKAVPHKPAPMLPAPNFKAPKLSPSPLFPHDSDSELPPYSDPNTI
jgi:hypothetical protein